MCPLGRAGRIAGVTVDVIVDSGKRDPNSDNTIYANRHRHTQTLKVQSPYIPIVMTSDMPEGVDVASRDAVTVVVDFDQFAEAARLDPEFFTDEVYEVRVDQNGVFELIQIYQA